MEKAICKYSRFPKYVLKGKIELLFSDALSFQERKKRSFWTTAIAQKAGPVEIAIAQLEMFEKE